MERCAFFTPPVDKNMFPKMAEEIPNLRATGRHMRYAVLSTASKVYRHEAYLSDS